MTRQEIDNEIERYEAMGFNQKQLLEVRYGLIYGLSIEQINIYARQEFNNEQMHYIRYGLEYGMSKEDILAYAKPEFSTSKMAEMMFTGIDEVTKQINRKEGMIV